VQLNAGSPTCRRNFHLAAPRTFPELGIYSSPERRG
jgi:hypothetical protein